jgi:mxaA protein
MKRATCTRLRVAWTLAALAIPAVAPVAQELPDLTPASEAVARPAGPPPNAIVEQPRPFGYVIGDVMTQRILLQVDGRDFEPAALPRTERVGAWLERRTPRVEVHSDGRRWLVADYQVINAPQTLTVVNVPAWEIHPGSGATRLRIGDWPISVSPLTSRTAFGQGDLAELRPDRPPLAIDTEPMRRRIAVLLGAFTVTLIIWMGWLLWREWRARAAQPFARALREMRRYEDSAPQAWHALHRAFDRTAGQALQSATLPDLFRQAPQLLPLRAQVEQFFIQSGERFFGTGLPAQTLSVRKLCAELRRMEKRHE